MPKPKSSVKLVLRQGDDATIRKVMVMWIRPHAEAVAFDIYFDTELPKNFLS